MKPHVRYGTRSTASGAAFNVVGRRPCKSWQEAAMIEEYKLEDQHLSNTLDPYYETSATAAAARLAAAAGGGGGSSSSAPFRCFLSSSSASSTSSKPALRTVSIMETLSELTGASAAAPTAGSVTQGAMPTTPASVNRMSRLRVAATTLHATPPHDAPAKSSGAKTAFSSSSNNNNNNNVAHARRKKTTSLDGNSLLDMPGQWYPAKKGHETLSSHLSTPNIDQRAWDVSRSKLALAAAAAAARRGRSSVEDILSSPSAAAVTTAAALKSSSPLTTSVQGYGSLERRRRRRPGMRTALTSARRGETDWEREEDEEEDDEEEFAIRAAVVQRSAKKDTPMSNAKFNATSVAAAAVAHQAVAGADKMRMRGSVCGKVAGGSTVEWFKKKRAVQGKERGQTPDWIHAIFHVARKGNVSKLQNVISGMEPTLVRNLSDHRGNNLLHVLAGAGNVDALEWLCSSFGPEMQDALLDENKRGLTPVVAAIQAGRLEAFQFLVDHTSARDRLAPVDSDRSLMHIAAKYGKVDLVAWLAQYMESRGFQIDLRDHCGHTPLHLAARAGHASAVAILVAHGSDVTAKNDMGHRPLDLASAHGHVGVAQLLRLHDAALGLACEVLEANEELDNLRGDYAELKSYFRDVLVIGKRLAKERDEMCRQLGRLYIDVTSLHQGLVMELRTLHRELANMQSRDRSNTSRKVGEAAESLDDSVAVVEALHERWQNHQRSWFSGNLADMEHRLLIAEDGWKRLRTCGSKHRSCQVQPHELLRSRLVAVNAQANNMQCEIPNLSSSEGSLYSACCDSESGSSDAESVNEQIAQCNSCFTSTSFHATQVSTAPAYKTMSQSNLTMQSRSSSATASAAGATTCQGRNSEEDSSFPADGVYSTLQAAVRKMNCAVELHEQDASVAIEQQARIRDNDAGNKKKSTRQELRKRLQEVKLTSESGNASVIEVIEPSSSDGEDDSIMSPSGRPRDQSTPLRNIPNTRSFNASFSEELEKARQNKVCRPSAVTSAAAAADNLIKAAEAATAGAAATTTTSFTARDDSFVRKSFALAEPDLLAGTIMRESAPLISPRSVVGSRVVQVSSDLMEAGPGDAEADYEQVMVGSSTRSSSSLSNVISLTKKKSGGFFNKFALKARWSSKRKCNNNADAAIISAESQCSASPDLSIEDPCLHDDPGGHCQVDNDRYSNSSMAAGVVAGLSQMFEDLSKSKPLASSQSAGSCGVAVDHKRGPSRNSTASESDYAIRCQAADFHQADCHEENVAALPSATSPPPVPMEMETYNSSPSSQETSLVQSPCSRLPVNDAGRSLPHPPPPLRFSSHLAKSSSDLSKVGTASSLVTPSSSSSSSTSASHGGVESLSVAASEDSGIVVTRPGFNSKSDSFLRPATSSAYSFTPFKNTVGFPLRKTSSVSEELAIQDPTAGERLSPAPSDSPKTGSPLSPPSNASDLSKTESMRNFRQLACIEETSTAAANSTNAPLMQLPNESVCEKQQVLKVEVVSMSPTVAQQMSKTDVKVAGVVDMVSQSGQILTWREAKLKNQVVTPPPIEERHLKPRVRVEEKSIRTLKKRQQVSERPWYDVSDDESDLLTPGNLTKLKTSQSSSEEDLQV